MVGRRRHRLDFIVSIMIRRNFSINLLQLRYNHVFPYSINHSAALYTTTQQSFILRDKPLNFIINEGSATV